MCKTPVHREFSLRYVAALFAVAVLAAVGGCDMRGNVRPLTSEAPPPPTIERAPENCTAERAVFALGRRITAPLLEEMRQRTGAFSASTAAQGALVVGAESQHLTVGIGANAVVMSARCG